MQKLQPLLQENDDLKSDISKLNLRLDEKDFKHKALEEELRMAERQLERLENQNKIFLSDSDISDDSSEESKTASGSNTLMLNSFEDSTDRSRTSENNNTRATINSTAKSMDSGLESENIKAFQETLEGMQTTSDRESHKARQEMLQFAEKALAEKTAMAKSLDHLKDKQKAFKSKLAS